MSDKKVARIRRAKRSRLRMREQDVIRLSVFRTSRHIYAQIISGDGGKILAAASTLEKGFSGPSGNSDAATNIGKLIADRAKAKGVSKVAFDRSGYQYHGRVKALAEAARENGLEF